MTFVRAVVLVGLYSADPKAITLDWEKNFLYVRAADLPGGAIVINYLEAFCRSGSTDRDWAKTVIPHRTTLVDRDPNRLRLRSDVEANVIVDHEITAGIDNVEFRLTATNRGTAFADVQWAQPCMRVAAFTGRKQDDYYRRCFIFTERGMTLLHQTHRATKARYVPGQVYVPNGVDRADVNPRPISDDIPVHGLIGAFSFDNRKLVAMAFEPYQELFQGVIVCIHADFRVGGLQPGETKKVRGKLYLLDNDVPTLLARYERDFGVQRKR
jgi:hypothetical protein